MYVPVVGYSGDQKESHPNNTKNVELWDTEGVD